MAICTWFSEGDTPMESRQEQHATFTLERRLDAPPAAVFAAWAEPALKRRWFGEADGWEDVEHRLDFRVGGSEYSSARQPGGPRQIGRASCRERVCQYV